MKKTTMGEQVSSGRALTDLLTVATGGEGEEAEAVEEGDGEVEETDLVKEDADKDATIVQNPANVPEDATVSSEEEVPTTTDDDDWIEHKTTPKTT